MLNEEIVITSHEDLLAAIVAVLFTPREMGEDFIKYDKESIFALARTLDSVFQLWYNMPLDMQIETEKES
jgi:hypothetical protein